MTDPVRPAQGRASGLPVAGPAKVASEAAKLAAYLRGQPVFPTTLEIDLTTACTRTCPECPSTTAPVQQTLSHGFLEWLFDSLEGQTPGLLLTGGEPTMAPLFGTALALARERGFVEIAVVTNGTRLDRPEVLDPLLAHVTTIRLSLYDWAEAGDNGTMDATLRLIAKLRDRLEREGSALRIGVSALTSSSRAHRLADLGRAVSRAGAHWLYFHPLCRKWGQGTPELDDQDGVLEAVAALASRANGGPSVHLCRERYSRRELRFDGYHAAHFLLVVGADGCNYLAPEVKYQPGHVIADLGSRPANPIHCRERLGRIGSVRSSDYPARGSRHRGVLYCDWIESRIKDRSEETATAFAFPFIL